MNDNGERLCDFCETNRLTVGGTLFQHKEIHKFTWKSPDGKTEIQIDHIIINNKWKRSLNDVRVKRLADVGSNHHLLVAKVKPKLRKSEQVKPEDDALIVASFKNPRSKESLH